MLSFLKRWSHIDLELYHSCKDRDRKQPASNCKEGLWHILAKYNHQLWVLLLHKPHPSHNLPLVNYHWKEIHLSIRHYKVSFIDLELYVWNERDDILYRYSLQGPFVQMCPISFAFLYNCRFSLKIYNTSK